MKETKTIEEKARQKPQETSDEDMGIKPPHISDEEMVRMIAEARKEEGIDGKTSKANVYKALGL